MQFNWDWILKYLVNDTNGKSMSDSLLMNFGTKKKVHHTRNIISSRKQTFDKMKIHVHNGLAEEYHKKFIDSIRYIYLLSNALLIIIKLFFLLDKLKLKHMINSLSIPYLLVYFTISNYSFLLVIPINFWHIFLAIVSKLLVMFSQKDYQIS